MRLARKLHIFLPLWLLAMGRDEERERGGDREGVKKRKRERKLGNRMKWQEEENGKPRSRKHFST